MNKKLFFAFALICAVNSRAMDAPPLVPSIEDSDGADLSDGGMAIEIAATQRAILTTKQLLFTDMYRAVRCMTDGTVLEDIREYHRWKYTQLAAHPLAPFVMEDIKKELQNQSFYSILNLYSSIDADSKKEE